MEELWGKGSIDRQNVEHHSHCLVRNEAWNRGPLKVWCVIMHHFFLIWDLAFLERLHSFVLFFENYLYSFSCNSNMLSLSFNHVNSIIVQTIETCAVLKMCTWYLRVIGCFCAGNKYFSRQESLPPRSNAAQHSSV